MYKHFNYNKIHTINNKILNTNKHKKLKEQIKVFKKLYNNII